MTETIQIILFLLAVLVVVAVVAQRLNTAPSILLVVAGIALALIPGLPPVELAPELVLLVLLPPLIYSAGVSMSWREFRFNLRPITLLAFGCVVFTTCAVAAAVHYLLGWQWGVAFVLGAIVAPPDVVAPLAIARRLGLPRRLLVVLEGEGLANDATALILYRFAVVAISTGSFSLSKAGGTFGLIVLGEIFYGIGVGWLSLRLRQWAQNPRVEITLSLMTPYLAYLDPRASRRLRRAGDRRLRPLRELERAAADSGRDAAAGHLLLGPDHLSDRGLRLPHHRPAGAHADREGARLPGPRAAGGHRAHRRHRHRGALRLDLSGDLSAALAHPVAGAARSVAAVAADVHPRIHRRARRGLARRGARHSADRRRRRAVSAPRPDPVRHLRRHHHHPGRSGPDAAGRDPLARRRPPRQGRASPRAGGRACRAQRGDRARRGSISRSSTEERKLSAETVEFLNARHDHRERLIPERPRRRARRHPCQQRRAAGADRGRARLPLRAAARRQDHRRIAAAAGARSRSGRGHDPGAARRRRRCSAWTPQRPTTSTTSCRCFATSPR